MQVALLLRSLTIAAVSALVLAPPALSHVDVQPRLVESGGQTTLLVELPELRPNLNPERLDVAANGLEQRSSSLIGRVGTETRWRVVADIAAPPGPLDVTLRARFADGRTVDVPQTLTVLPARADETPWLTLTATAGLFAIAAAALLFLHRRRASSTPRRG